MSKQLFEPTQLGPLTLTNRIVMAPMTRCRALGNEPNELMAEYYRQRATAGLIVAEGTSPDANGLGYARIPGLFTEQHVANWQRVTETVHHHGGHIFLQLMHSGRIFHPLNLPAGAEGVGPSAVAAAGQMWTDQQQMQDHPAPRALTTAEVAETVKAYAHSAKLAMDAGFDGVEVHAANGYLPEQFLNPHSNQRTDEYGGSVENRTRFVLDITRAVAAEIGADRTGIRLSPGSSFNDMAAYPEVAETYAHLAQELQKIGVVYVHLVGTAYLDAESRAALETTYTGPVIYNGGYNDLARAEADLAGRADFISFGTAYISNPDLVERLKAGQPLAEADQATFYAPGPAGFADGYTDYPTADGQPAGSFAPDYVA